MERRLWLWERVLLVRDLLNELAYILSSTLQPTISPLTMLIMELVRVSFWVSWLLLTYCARCHDVPKELNLRYEHQARTSNSFGM